MARQWYQQVGLCSLWETAFPCQPSDYRVFKSPTAANSLYLPFLAASLSLICACADNASARSSVINALHRALLFPHKIFLDPLYPSGVSTRIRAPQVSTVKEVDGLGCADVKSRTHPGARSRILRTHPLRVLHEAQMSLSLKQPGRVPRVMMLLE